MNSVQARRYAVAVIGATGMVGEAVLSLLAERDFPAGKIHALASARSFGEDVDYGGRSLPVGDLAAFDFAGVDLAIFAVPPAVAAEGIPRAVAAGSVAIDLSGQFADEADVPLVVPEANPEALADCGRRGVVASPGIVSALIPVLKPLHAAAGIVRLRLGLCQPVSAAGRGAVEKLARQTAALLSAQPVELAPDEIQAAFNVVPATLAEAAGDGPPPASRLAQDIRRVLGDAQIAIDASVMRVPVFFGYSCQVWVETREPIEPVTVSKLLGQAPGVALLSSSIRPTAVGHASGRDEVFVGTIRRDQAQACGLYLWVVADNLRKGSALNGVQIAEILIKDYI
ncbi:aspartate-semialdehyde dehydrogenase [Acidihalobacter prosperus]|uniref:Semialdehyde dehydrogenase NAD-binding domain-containing protein n=1 Tax=Acidihalobacter prosperus TaxID=160660 RepID=A0A1A6C2Y2_9GAMM|nr:aspartate-semialdehyde dehydrogenase [Acidihalobacter prosperus]OBS08905.1 hypothetical protein Thpro_023155 [Acidihalobacter prosperus]